MSETVQNYYKNTPSLPDSFKFIKKRPFSEVNTKEETLGSCSDMGDSSHSKKREELDSAELKKKEDLISLVSVTDENLDQLKKIAKVLFPSLYDDDHFADSLASGEFTQLALYDEYCVGAVECRLERKPDNTVRRVYLKNLGVLEPNRRCGIGTRLMNHVLDCCAKERVIDVYVHVSPGNENAINFYKKFGFEKERTVFGYYENPKTPASYYVFRATIISNTS